MKPKIGDMVLCKYLHCGNTIIMYGIVYEIIGPKESPFSKQYVKIKCKNLKMDSNERIYYKGSSYPNVIFEDEIIGINPKKSDVFLELL